MTDLTRNPYVWSASVVLLLGLLLLSCGARTAATPEASDPLTDTNYLTASLWNDGQAEVAFYEVERSRNQYGQEEDQRFLVGTYLVKHDFDPQAMSKAGREAEERISSFKYGLFYEFESGSYQYKRSYVVNAAQEDLRPLKQSYASFDWCSNAYRELAFHPDGTVSSLFRSDDYGNGEASFEYRPHAFPVAVLPVLVRGLDFDRTEEHAFTVILPEGKFVPVTARIDGRETIEGAGGPVEAERITLTYEEPVPSVVAEETDTSETYWRDTGPDRRLLKMESASGRYRMTLVEHLRTAYWEENLWPRLTTVTQRP